MVKLAVIGCGNIAEFHINAMRAVGFSIVSIAARLNSSNVEAFSKNNNIQKVYKNPLDLLNSSSEWDALLLLTPASVMVDYLKLVAPLMKPILVEKPVADNHIDLQSVIKYKNIRVAYNRRFYSGVEFAKIFIQSNPRSLIKVTIPEYRKDPEHNIEFPNRLPAMTYENSVHILDIVNYISGEVEWDYLKNIKDDNKFIALLAIGQGSCGATIQLDSYYNASDNFSINIVSDNEMVEMKPIEVTSLFKGMEVNEPTKEMPIRIYTPILQNKIIESPRHGHKPGFLGQAQDFMNFCLGRESSSGADIIDAYSALKLAHSLVK